MVHISKSSVAESSSVEESDGNDIKVVKKETSKRKQKKTSEELWLGVRNQDEERLPEGIDGMQAFLIHITEEESIINILKDGRKWKRNCPTSWKGHRRIRYADCRGSNKCGNDNCPYRIEYGLINTVQFKRKGITVCRGCGQLVLSVPCSARRYLSYGKSAIKVYCCGVHTCPVIKKVAKNNNQIAQLVKDNPNIKPSQVQSACVLSAFRQMANWGSVKK